MLLALKLQMLQQTAPEQFPLRPLPDQRKIGTKASASDDFKRPYEGQKYFSLFHTNDLR